MTYFLTALAAIAVASTTMLTSAQVDGAYFTGEDVDVASMYIICWRDNYVEEAYAGCTTMY